jgi:acyl-CoA synthetase (AMP-forming)/AMP-acid ligase II
VVGFAKLPEGEDMAAIIVPSSNLTEAALVAHCPVRLSPDKRPRKSVFMRELPRNANGKISRGSCANNLKARAKLDLASCRGDLP